MGELMSELEDGIVDMVYYLSELEMVLQNLLGEMEEHRDGLLPIVKHQIEVLRERAAQLKADQE